MYPQKVQNTWPNTHSLTLVLNFPSPFHFFITSLSFKLPIKSYLINNNRSDQIKGVDNKSKIKNSVKRWQKGLVVSLPSSFSRNPFCMLSLDILGESISKNCMSTFWTGFFGLRFRGFELHTQCSELNY